jgi:hypothetical protein
MLQHSRSAAALILGIGSSVHRIEDRGNVTAPFITKLFNLPLMMQDYVPRLFESTLGHTIATAAAKRECVCVCAFASECVDADVGWSDLEFMQLHAMQELY